MKTKNLIAIVTIGFFTIVTIKAQENSATMKMDSMKMNQSNMHMMHKNMEMMDHSKMKMMNKDKEMKCDSTKMTMNHSEMTHDQMANATYACPMKCEGEKTYDKPGSCPKCNMDLKKMEIKKEK